MKTRLWKENGIQMMKMMMYAFGPVAFTVYATQPEQLERQRRHLKNMYGIECKQPPIKIDRETYFEMQQQKRKQEEQDLKEE